MSTVHFGLSVLGLYNLLARSQEGRNYGEHELAALRDLRNGIIHGPFKHGPNPFLHKPHLLNPSRHQILKVVQERWNMTPLITY